MTQHPYRGLPNSAFWRSGVAEDSPESPTDLYLPKFPVERKTAIATAGSCFAQHVGRALRQAGVNVLDLERAPRFCPPAMALSFGYGIYSARYGNIYTTRQLVQLIKDAQSGEVDPAAIWQRDGRFHDALRPAIEPDGFVSATEVAELRRAHLAAVKRLFSQTSCLIFTLGLTECWADRDSGRVYPTCPGVIAGEFDPERHTFLNLRVSEVMADLQQARDLLQLMRRGMRMILTVSPVPLTATATGGHVLTATTRSKAVLRAAADEFAAAHDDVDYFPSYEIVTNPAARGGFFQPNLREVTAAGVAAAMNSFLSAHGLESQMDQPATPEPQDPLDAAEELFCEEILLEAGGR